MNLTGRSVFRGQGFRVTERSVTPVVGVVVMLGITVSLVVIVAPLIFSGSTVDSGPPSIGVAFVYEENNQASQEDSFGTTGGSDSGVLTIQVKEGDDVNAGQIRVESNLSGGNLVDDTDSSEYESGDSILAGDEITVWTERGDEVRFIWTSDDGDDSYIIDKITILPTQSAETPGIPDADHECDGWSFPGDFDNADGISAGSGDLTIDGVVLDCDLSDYNIDNVDIKGDGANIGNVEANSNINIINGATYDGYIEAGNDMDLNPGNIDATYVDVTNKIHAYSGSNSTISVEDNVTAGNGIDLYGDTIEGDAIAEDDVNLADGASITGDLDATANDVIIKEGSDVGGNVDADSNVKVNDGTVEGYVDATGNAIIKNSATVNGDVESDSGITVKSSSSVTGNLNGSGTVNLKDSTITGYVNSTDTVELDEKTTVSGHVYVDSSGDLTCNDGNDSTINGVGCKDYKNTANYVVTIDSTNSPVEEGNTLDVTATIENEYLGSASQKVTLEINGYQNDSKSISVGAHAATTKTFQWSTSGGDSNTYNASVISDNDSADQSVEVVGDAPPKFESLTVTLEQVQSNKGNLKKSKFTYSLSESTTTTFEIVKNGDPPEETTDKSGSGATDWTWNHNKVSLSVIIRVDTNGGECYKIRIPSDASQGDTYDILSKGFEC
jgi:flagellin-like protein